MNLEQSFLTQMANSIFFHISEVDTPKAVRYMWRIIDTMLILNVEYDQAALIVFAITLEQIVENRNHEIMDKPRE